MAIATFGAGCFWGVEETFRKTPGVTETAVGYSGGETDSPTYQQVCTGQTGHAEVVRVEFDPEKITYQQLLDVFWSCHDPTQLNRQGPDTGTQYRSVIFTHDENQARVASESRDTVESSDRFRSPIVTRIEPAGEFFPAEEYHQKYLLKRGQDQCHF